MGAKKIFIIDDDHNSVAALKEFLLVAGYEVNAAFDGKEGLEKIKIYLPDLILLDLVLPDQSGFRIAQEIRDMPEYANIPIIAISLKREEVDKHIAAKSGIADYIEKPIDYQKLLFSIKDILK